MSVFSIFNHPGCYFMDSYYLFGVLLSLETTIFKFSSEFKGNFGQSTSFNACPEAT